MPKITELRKKLGDFCHICGYQMDFGALGTNNPAAPTRDHIIPEKLIKMGASAKGQRILLAHALCNSIRGVGEANFIKHPKLVSFYEWLEARGISRNPNYKGPVNHDLPIPEQFSPHKYSFYFVLFGLQFDFLLVGRKYWHFRIGAKTIDMLILAGKRGR